MPRRLLVGLVISLCILGLSFHFIVEGLGGVHDHFIGHSLTGMMDSHEGDQFILTGPEISDTTQVMLPVSIPSNLSLISRHLPPPFHPPNFF